MRLTRSLCRDYAAAAGIVVEITESHRSAEERYEVIRCNHPGATSYGCRDMEEVWDAVSEIVEDAEKIPVLA